MTDTKRVRNMPATHLVPQWISDIIQNLVTAAGICPHYNADGDSVSAADASDLATSKTLTLDIVDTFVLHGLDTGIHSAADAALDVPAEAASHPSEPADLAEVQATLNVLKTDLNTHIANATPHRGLGGEAGLTVALVTTANGSDQATCNTLANALKVAFNRHALADDRTEQVMLSVRDGITLAVRL